MTAQSVTKDVALTFTDLGANCNISYVNPLPPNDTSGVAKVHYCTFHSLISNSNIPFVNTMMANDAYFIITKVKTMPFNAMTCTIYFP